MSVQYLLVPYRDHRSYTSSSSSSSSLGSSDCNRRLGLIQRYLLGGNPYLLKLGVRVGFKFKAEKLAD
jgi:hypothetical protein